MGKNLGLLGQEVPPWRQPDILEEITALQGELAKGTAVYTNEELSYLARKLAEREDLLRTLING